MCHIFLLYPMAQRCCCKIDAEFTPCYASVLAFGIDQQNIQNAVREMEEDIIIPCFTAWCPRYATFIMIIYNTKTYVDLWILNLQMHEKLHANYGYERVSLSFGASYS